MRVRQHLPSGYSQYISETKGNAAYGNQNGVIGSYDAVIRTNITGRKSNNTLTLIWDSDPSLRFTGGRIFCYEDRNPDLNCGTNIVSDRTMSSTSWRWSTGLMNGEKLVNGNYYYNQYATSFTPTGYSKYTAGKLNTQRFWCPRGAAGCYFP